MVIGLRTGDLVLAVGGKSYLSTLTNNSKQEEPWLLGAAQRLAMPEARQEVAASVLWASLSEGSQGTVA